MFATEQNTGGEGDSLARQEDRKMNGLQSPSRVTGSRFMGGKLGHPSPILLALAGFDGKLKFLNPAWEKILGYPAQELLERPLCDLMQHERPVAVALVDRLLAEDSLERLEFGLRCKDGTCRWFLWHRRFDSEHQAIFIAGYDITEQKSQEITSLLRSYDRSKRADAAV
jgi:PAS domain S-box-containing protein